MTTAVSIDPRIESALRGCRERGIPSVILVVPFDLLAEEAAALASEPLIAGLVARNANRLSDVLPAEWLGRYSDDGLDWKLPARSGEIVFVGPHVMITRLMVRSALRRHRLRIVCASGDRLVPVPVYKFFLWKAGDEIIRWLGRLGPDHPALRLLGHARRIGWAKRLWHRQLRRKSGVLGAASADGTPAGIDRSQDIKLYRELLRCAKADALPPGKFIPRRVLLVNAGLAAGGAERQLVNTLLGLQDRGLESISMLGEYLFTFRGLDFYLPDLQHVGVSAEQVRRRVTIADHGLTMVPPDVAELLGQLPPPFAEEILNLSLEFRVRRPEVVHAWQDQTSIKCGLAAVLAGVPRIVLASRNVNPTNFTYHQSYMKPGYLALADLENVTLVNNSDAGALDYCRWLGIDRSRFKVVRNGIDFSRFHRTNDAQTRALRAGLGIPPEAPLVGSVFRFWAEKRPMLWLETARAIAARRRDAHFLIVGDGVMRREMERYVRSQALEDCVHLPGTSFRIADQLSAMQLFLLTSEFEGTPNVVLEAEWFGLPVVATESGGTRDALEEGITGWIEDPDPGRLADLVVAVLDDPARLEWARERGPAFVRAQFGLDRMLDETLVVYGYPELASRPAGRSL